MTRPPTSGLLGAIGDTDCEYLHDGFLAQPVNAWTSFGYVALGLVAVAVSLRLRRRRWESAVFGVLLAAIGLGSVLFHGPQPDGSKGFHDLPILLLALLMLVHDLALLRPGRRVLRWFAPVSVVVALLGLAIPDVVPPLTFAAIAAVIVLEWFVHRSGARPVEPRTERRAYLAMGGLALVGAASWVLGRTGAPLCDPDTVAQPHGAWHLLSGLVFGTWWWLAYVKSDAPGDDGEVSP